MLLIYMREDLDSHLCPFKAVRTSLLLSLAQIELSTQTPMQIGLDIAS